jgi:hypothetical protein
LDGGPGADLDTFKVETAVVDIYHDRVAIPEPRDRAARSRFGADMADHQAPSCSAEPAVCDQCHCLAEPFADQGRCYLGHFPHAWAATRSLIADDHDVARADPLLQDGLQSVFFGFEDHCRAAMGARRAR